MNANELVPLLLEACPTAKPAWDEHVAFWKPEKRGNFNDIAVFAHHVVDSLAQGRRDEFPAFFALVEQMIVEGDQDVVALAVLGLIEDIQVIASNSPKMCSEFQDWLGPKSRQGWLEITAAWEGKESLADVIRAERKRQS